MRGENEPLSGGGKSSGLMSFLKIGDRAAGAIKSGGTTRRAAKMVILDADHPDIETFVDWKVIEEQKVAALVTGSKLNNKHLNAIMKACHDVAGRRDEVRPQAEQDADKGDREARLSLIPANYIERVIQLAQQGFTSIHFPEYNTDWNSEAYATVERPEQQQQRARDQRLHAGRDRRATGTCLAHRVEKATKEGRAPRRKKLKARDCGTRCRRRLAAAPIPGMQYHTTVNEWHTCLADGEN